MIKDRTLIPQLNTDSTGLSSDPPRHLACIFLVLAPHMPVFLEVQVDVAFNDILARH
jgi:hypothetical protein